MYECIINEQYICPYKEISIKLCSKCKLPDSYCQECGGTEYKHYLDCSVWKKLKNKFEMEKLVKHFLGFE